MMIIKRIEGREEKKKDTNTREVDQDQEAGPRVEKGNLHVHCSVSVFIN